MCIEKEIAANTAAINALTAAVRQLLAALPSRLDGLDACSVVVDDVPPRKTTVVERILAAADAVSGPVPVSVAPVPVSVAPAPVAPAPAPVAPAPAPVAPAPAPVTPAPAPVTPAPAPAASAPAHDGMWYPGGGEIPETPLTLADVRSVCVRAGQAGYTQAVVDFLASRGVKLLTELPPAQYPALLMMLAEKGVR